MEIIDGNKEDSTNNKRLLRKRKHVAYCDNDSSGSDSYLPLFPKGKGEKLS